MPRSGKTQISFLYSSCISHYVLRNFLCVVVTALRANLGSSVTYITALNVDGFVRYSLHSNESMKSLKE